MKSSKPLRVISFFAISAVAALHGGTEAQGMGLQATYRGEVSTLGISYTYFSLSGSPSSVVLQSTGPDALEVRVLAGGGVFCPSPAIGGPSHRKVDIPAGLQDECIVQVRAPEPPAAPVPYTLLVQGMSLSPREAGRAVLIAEIEDSEMARKRRIDDYLERHPLSFMPTSKSGDSYIEDIVDGEPVLGTTYNVIAQKTNSASPVMSGGSLGLNLTGSRLPPIGVWDPGRASTTHPEFAGRISFGDESGVIGTHATHISGTIAAAGMDAKAKGFVPKARIITYSSSNDAAEMTAAARDGMLLSNHSYGSGGSNYSPAWDKVALVSEFYLPVRAAGNGGDGKYMVVTTLGNCKNVMTVGSVGDLADGYKGPDKVTLSSYNRFGPTTDGRIKPDIMSNGSGLYSTQYDGGDGGDSYGSSSGTSMATPAALGSMALMQEYYFLTHQQTFMKAATLKGLVIATAHEIGAPGPAYNSGWGLINTRGAVELIMADDSGRGGVIRELSLENRDTVVFTFKPKPGDTPSVTLCWTDPLPGTNLSESDPKLVNDLDLRLTIDGNPYLPWKPDPSRPEDAASKGDNILDNVEKVSAEKAGGQVMTVRVTHKRSLGSRQNFSLIVKGAFGKGAPVALRRNQGKTRPIAGGKASLASSARTSAVGPVARYSLDGKSLGSRMSGYLFWAGAGTDR